MGQRYGIVELDGDWENGIEGYWNLFVHDVTHKSRPAGWAARVREARAVAAHYLVVLVGTMDELPVRLFFSEAEACEFVRENFPHPAEGHECRKGSPQDKASDVIGYGPSNVLGWAIVRFEDGRPTGVVRCWDDGTDADTVDTVTTGGMVHRPPASPLTWSKK